MYCVVRNCKSIWTPNSNIKFHSFPTNIIRRNTWLSIISIKGKFYESAKICSLHFKSEDYDWTGRLQKNATPFYLPTSCDCGSTATECPSTLEKWRSALSQPLTENHFICEFHFKAEDVIREDKIKMPDGSVYRSPRIKYNLASGAIPVSIIPLEVESREIHHNGHHNGLLIDMTIDEKFNSDRVINKFDISDDSNQQICDSDSEINDEIMLDENYVSDIVEDETSANAEVVEVAEAHCFINNPEENSIKFSLKKIQDVLKDQALPFNWSRSGTFDYEKNVTLFYIDCLLMKVKFKMVISADFNIMITVADTGISLNYYHPISSVSDFWSLLRIIGRSQVCSGSGVPHKKCSDECRGILSPQEAYKRYEKEKRCFQCRNLRRKLIRSGKNKKCDINERLMTIKRKLHAKSKRCLRLQKRNDELKSKIVELRKQCAMVKGKILKDEISNLPKAQREAVQACFKSAKAKNKSQRSNNIDIHYVFCECGDTFPTEEALKDHLERDHNHRVQIERNEYKCDTCEKIFASEKSCLIHQRIHTNPKAKKERALAERRKYYRIKNIVCEVCGKRFAYSSYLRNHQRMHTGERPYKCTECPKSFTMPLFLQRHIRIHTGERPYQCPHCPKAFSNKAALVRHDRVHTGIRPYKCPQCDKHFTQSNARKHHYNTVHLKMPDPYKSRKRQAKLARRQAMNTETQIEESVYQPQEKMDLGKNETEGEVYQGDVYRKVYQDGDMFYEEVNDEGSEVAMYANDEEPEVLYEEVVCETEKTGV